MIWIIERAADQLITYLGNALIALIYAIFDPADTVSAVEYYRHWGPDGRPPASS